MQLSHAVLASIFATVAFSQTGSIDGDVAAIPACAQTCLLTAIQAGGCGLTDYACQCGSAKNAITASATPCVLKGCSTSDATKVTALTDDICKIQAAAPASSSASSASSAAPESSSSSSAASSAASSASSSASSASSAVSSSASSEASSASSSITSAKSSMSSAAASATSAGASSATTTPAATTGAASSNKAGALVAGAAALIAFAL